jgi:cell division protease FtsH
LTAKGLKTNFFNLLNVHKVTILPMGQSLGHTAFIPNKDILSQNKKDIMKMIGRVN